MKNFGLGGKTALITGASKGIGAAAARAFVAAGANVVLAARSSEQITEIAAELGDRALAVSCDVSKYDDVTNVVEKTAMTFGGLDILIGNAGVIEPMGLLTQNDPTDWGKTIDINLKGVMHGMHAVLPGMIAQGHGTIITVSSGAAHHPLEGWSGYCSSKAGAYMLTRVADTENREKGIRILGLSPGTVATDMQREIKKSGVGPVSKLDWSDHIPSEWPAQALMWMCTTEANDFLGDDISLRDETIRQKVGLV